MSLLSNKYDLRELFRKSKETTTSNIMVAWVFLGGCIVVLVVSILRMIAFFH